MRYSVEEVFYSGFPEGDAWNIMWNRLMSNPELVDLVRDGPHAIELLFEGEVSMPYPYGYGNSVDEVCRRIEVDIRPIPVYRMDYSFVAPPPDTRGRFSRWLAKVEKRMFGGEL